MSQKKVIPKSLLAAVILPLLFTSCAEKQNWPQFRGPEGNMVLSSPLLPERWGNDTNILWTASLDGTGFSSPVVWGNKVFITSVFPEKVNPVPDRGPAGGPPQGGQAGPQQGQGSQQGPGPRTGQLAPSAPAVPPPDIPDTSYKNELYRWDVICLDLKTGKELWKRTPYSGAPRSGKNPMATYANETPVTDGERVYAFFGMHGLYCYDMDGNPVWQKDLGAFHTQRGWGTGSSPILHNGVLFIQFDNEENSFITALEATTGEEKWKVMRDEKTTYSTPYLWKNHIRTELIAAGRTIRSYDPETGSLLWEMKTTGDMIIPSPVGNDELLFIGLPGGRETKAKLLAIKAGASGNVSDDYIAWQSEESGLGNPSPLLYGNNLFITGSRGEMAVIDAVTGAVRVQKRLSGISVWSSPWINNNIVYSLDANGVTRAFKADDTLEQVAENRLEGSKFWSSVAATRDRYIFRCEGKVYCAGTK